jgi:oligopeptide transport system substrate-binding protein
VPALCGCKPVDAGKTVYWLLSSSPKNLDPQTAKGESELNVIKNCFSGLFEKDQNGELISSVVEHYTVSKDGLKYTFYFYDNLYWSIVDGRKIQKYAPLTADDFVFAIERIFTDNPDCSVMNVLRSIKNADKVLSGADASALSVKAENDSTLSITLKEKNSALIEALTSPELFPCNRQFFASTSGRYGLSVEAMIFNGSFCVFERYGTLISVNKKNRHRNFFYKSFEISVSHIKTCVVTIKHIHNRNNQFCEKTVFFFCP